MMWLKLVYTAGSLSGIICTLFLLPLWLESCTALVLGTAY